MTRYIQQKNAETSAMYARLAALESGATNAANVSPDIQALQAENARMRQELETN